MTNKTIGFVLKVAIALGMAAAVLLPGGTARANTFLPGHDNTTAANHVGRWIHGNPNSGDFATPNGAGYYYLSIESAGDHAWCEVYDVGDWLIQVMPGFTKTILGQGTFHGTGGRVFATVAPGSDVRCRIANINTHGQAAKDYAELNSGNAGDANSDCGGPGPVVDPNAGNAPVEPPATATVGPAVANSCAVPTTTHGVELPANATTFPLNPNLASQTVTTAVTGDLTAISFHGAPGTAATMTITDAGGQPVNNPKVGGQPAQNPNTMNTEWVDADAGVLQPGTYSVRYSGPYGTGSRLAALLVPRTRL